MRRAPARLSGSRVIPPRTPAAYTERVELCQRHELRHVESPCRHSPGAPRPTREGPCGAIASQLRDRQIVEKVICAGRGRAGSARRSHCPVGSRERCVARRGRRPEGSSRRSAGPSWGELPVQEVAIVPKTAAGPRCRMEHEARPCAAVEESVEVRVLDALSARDPCLPPRAFGDPCAFSPSREMTARRCREVLPVLHSLGAFLGLGGGARVESSLSRPSMMASGRTGQPGT